MDQLQPLFFLLVSGVAGAFISGLAMSCFGNIIMLAFRHRELSFGIDASLAVVADRLRRRGGDEIQISGSKHRYQIELMQDNVFVFERLGTRFNRFTPAIVGTLNEGSNGTDIRANIQLSQSTVTGALAVAPAVWILCILQYLLSDTWNHVNIVWFVVFQSVIVPLAVFGSLRMFIFTNADDWQQDVDVFDSIVCGTDLGA